MNSIEITSMHNPMLKEYNKLKKNSNYRQKCCKIALEGPNLLHEATKIGLVPEVVFFTREYYNSENSSFLDSCQSFKTNPDTWHRQQRSDKICSKCHKASTGTAGLV